MDETMQASDETKWINVNEINALYMLYIVSSIYP